MSEIDKIGEELYYLMNLIGEEYYEDSHPYFLSVCGEPVEVRAFKNFEEGYLLLRVECSYECGEICSSYFKSLTIHRPYEEEVKRKSLGKEYFFERPAVLLNLFEDELEKTILGVEKGGIDIAFLDLNKGFPYLEVELSSVKGSTLYNISKMAKRSVESVHVFLDPEENSRYSLMFLDKNLEKKLLTLNERRKIDFA